MQDVEYIVLGSFVGILTELRQTKNQTQQIILNYASNRRQVLTRPQLSWLPLGCLVVCVLHPHGRHSKVILLSCICPLYQFSPILSYHVLFVIFFKEAQYIFFICPNCVCSCQCCLYDQFLGAELLYDSPLLYRSLGTERSLNQRE